MKSKGDILQRSLDFDLTEEELSAVENDQTDKAQFERAIHVSHEMFVLGYSKVLESKHKELESLLPLKTQKAKTHTLKYIIGIAAAILICLCLILFTKNTSSQIDDIEKELSIIAYNSFNIESIAPMERSDKLRADDLNKLLAKAYIEKDYDFIIKHTAGKSRSRELNMLRMVGLIHGNKLKESNEIAIDISAKYQIDTYIWNMALKHYKEGEIESCIDQLDIIIEKKYPNYKIAFVIKEYLLKI